MLKHLDTVSSEGGPFLIADLNIARQWRGTEEGGHDYDRAITPIDEVSDEQGHLLPVQDGIGLIWQTEGAGSCDVFLSDESMIVVLQAWLDDAGDESAVSVLAQGEGTDRISLGSIEVRSGILAILWAPESGACITGKEVVSGSATPEGALAVDGSALLVQAVSGRYNAWHDFVQSASGEARRLRLVLSVTA